MNYDDLVFLDTETTGADEQDRVCQVAYNYQGTEYNELFLPPVPISVEAMTVSHITNKMVADKPSFEGSDMQAHLKKLLEEGNKILVAHNAKFDIQMLAKDEISTSRYIDTLKVAQYLDPQGTIPRYGMQYLRYYLELDIDPQDAPAHDALGDIRVLIKLFERLYAKMVEQEGSEEQAIEKMMEVSTLPVCYKRFTFGKYKDKTIAEVAQSDKGYLEWLAKQKQEQRAQGNPDEDWEYTLQQYLG